MAVPLGNLQLDELLSMPDYDFHRVALLIDELQDAIDAVLSDEPDKKYDISWRVIEDDRPFHCAAAVGYLPPIYGFRGLPQQGVFLATGKG